MDDVKPVYPGGEESFEGRKLIFRVLSFSSKILWGRDPFVHLHEKFINAFYIKTEIQQIKPSPPPPPL